MTARAPNTGRRGKPPEFVTGQGEDEPATRTDLVLRLREMARPGQMAELERWMRLSRVAGAEERSQQTLGRGLTTEELARVVRRAPPAEQPVPRCPIGARWLGTTGVREEGMAMGLLHRAPGRGHPPQHSRVRPRGRFPRLEAPVPSG